MPVRRVARAERATLRGPTLLVADTGRADADGAPAMELNDDGRLEGARQAAVSRFAQTDISVLRRKPRSKPSSAIATCRQTAWLAHAR
jgi:hypothetical protein